MKVDRVQCHRLGMVASGIVLLTSRLSFRDVHAEADGRFMLMGMWDRDRTNGPGAR